MILKDNNKKITKKKKSKKYHKPVEVTEVSAKYLLEAEEITSVVRQVSMSHPEIGPLIYRRKYMNQICTSFICFI